MDTSLSGSQQFSGLGKLCRPVACVVDNLFFALLGSSDPAVTGGYYPPNSDNMRE
jgi:hypothetical protein